MVKYPNCPSCNSDLVRTSKVAKIYYWKCWFCGKQFTRDLLFEVVEIRKQKKEQGNENGFN